jgi:hypothetical protein
MYQYPYRVTLGSQNIGYARVSATTSYNDIFDTFRLALKFYHNEESRNIVDVKTKDVREIII